MVNRLLEAGGQPGGAGSIAGRAPDPTPCDGRRQRGTRARAESPPTTPTKFATWTIFPTGCEQAPEEYERIQNALNPTDPEGRTPLHRAAENESVLGVRKLLQAGADPNTARRSGERHSVAPGRPSPIRPKRCTICSRPRPTPKSRRTKTNATALHYAARNRSPDVTQRLLDAGADAARRRGIGRAGHPLTWPPHPIPPRP